MESKAVLKSMEVDGGSVVEGAFFKEISEN